MVNNNKLSLICAICKNCCSLVHGSLYDDRFGAPGRYDIIKCQHCGLEQTWPTFSENNLKQLYEQYYNWGGEQDTCYTKARTWLLNSGLYQLWLRWDGDMAFHLRQGAGRLLDLGCNEGRGLSLYAQNGFQVEGLELNERAAAVARAEGFTVYTTPMAEISPPQPYRVIILSNVLEHALDPLAMLTQVRRLLADDGQVWISCPNADSRWRQIFARHWINWHVPFHLFHFSPQSLTEVLTRAGFQLQELQTITPSLWVALSICARLGSKHQQANRLMRSAPVVGSFMLAYRVLLAPFFRQANKNLQGDCLIATATPLI